MDIGHVVLLKSKCFEGSYLIFFIILSLVLRMGSGTFCGGKIHIHSVDV